MQPAAVTEARPTLFTASRWQSGLSLAFVVACLAALEIYVGAGVIVIALPLVAVPRLSFQILLGFGIFVAVKTGIGLYADMGPAFATYAFSEEAAGREFLTLLTTVMMFVLGYKVITREMIDRVPSGRLLLIPVVNIIIHAVTRGDLFAATADNTQILSLYVLYVVATRRGRGTWSLAAVFLTVFLAIGLRNSFTSVAALAVLVCYMGRSLGWSGRVGPYRAALLLYIVSFMFLSLVAYLFVFRVTNETGELNNGYTRSSLAQFAYQTFFDHAFLGTTFGLPIVPSDAIYLLNWNQYLIGDTTSNIYGLSFHNSLLYLLTRLGILGYAALIWKFLRLAPRRGRLLDIIFTFVPVLFMSANVVIESVRAGPGVALVLGSLFSFVSGGGNRLMAYSATGTKTSWAGVGHGRTAA
jgi:hypothetical protein